MKSPSILEMLQAGVHFGHQVSRWHPKMKQFIFMERNGVHVINLEKTKEILDSFLPEIRKMAAEGKTILFVTTKPQARELVKNAAVSCGMPYLVDRWIGGLITNFEEIRKLIRHYVLMKDKQAKGELVQYTKKEQSEIGKELEKQDKNLAGLAGLEKMPDAVFVPSVQREKTAIIEANRRHVPIIGICDTNANPTKVKYAIPGNDDAIKSIELMVNLIAEAIKEGRKDAEKAKKEAV